MNAMSLTCKRHTHTRTAKPFQGYLQPDNNEGGAILCHLLAIFAIDFIGQFAHHVGQFTTIAVLYHARTQLSCACAHVMYQHPLSPKRMSVTHVRVDLRVHKVCGAATSKHGTFCFENRRSKLEGGGRLCAWVLVQRHSTLLWLEPCILPDRRGH